MADSRPRDPVTQRMGAFPFALVFDLAVKVGFPFLIGIAGWTFTRLESHEKRLIQLETIRISEAQAAARIESDLKEMRAEFRAELRALRDELKR